MIIQPQTPPDKPGDTRLTPVEYEGIVYQPDALALLQRNHPARLKALAASVNAALGRQAVRVGMPVPGEDAG